MQQIPQIEDIEKHLITLQEKKDKVMDLSREIIRLSGKTITMVHAQKPKEASAGIRELKALTGRLKKSDAGFEYFSLQAYQEYVEACCFYTIVGEQRLMTLKEMNVGEVAYLLGIMDLTGELKREAIDALRNKDGKRANLYYEFMKSIYDSTRAMRFSDSLVPEFRRKQDTARIQMETTAGELLNFELGRKIGL